MQKWHLFYIAFCDLLAEKLCYAKRSKVGAVIVKDHNILAYGYNGTPHGFPNVCEDIVVKDFKMTEASIMTDLSFKQSAITNVAVAGKIIDSEFITKPEVIHAEINAIAKAARQGISIKGATMYVSISPCIECAKLIIQSGITKVIYKDEYRDKAGVELLTKASVDNYKLSEIV